MSGPRFEIEHEMEEEEEEYIDPLAKKMEERETPKTSTFHGVVQKLMDAHASLNKLNLQPMNREYFTASMMVSFVIFTMINLYNLNFC